MSKLPTKLQSKSSKAAAAAKQPRPPPTLPPPEFLHVPLGSGGTFAPTLPLGTSACLNTVGVFFEISPSRAFCAHIDASVLRPCTPETEGGAGRKWYACNFISAARIRAEVFRRLDEEGFGGEGDRGRMRETLVLTCQRMYAPGEGTTRVAEVVAKAVMEWVGVGQEAGVVRQGAAVVAQWPQGRVWEFEDGVQGMTAVDAEVEEGGWGFWVEEVEVQGVEGSESLW